jgi:dephospho-CoA kinase
MLAARGARVIDADRIGHAVIDPSGAAFDAVAARWPEVVVDGRIDRRALGEIVFADPSELEELESITHPRIVNRLRSMLDTGSAIVSVIEVSVPHLPIDERWRRIVVVASDAVRRARLVRRGLSPDETDQRMAAQPDPSDWVQDGDLVIDNDGDLERLEGQVEQLWSSLLAMAS